MKRKNRILIAAVLVFLLLTGCESNVTEPDMQANSAADHIEIQPAQEAAPERETTEELIPAYAGNAYVEVNGNIPFYTDADMSLEAFEEYSELDELGRCGTAYANICPEIMPTEPRGEIGAVRPSGWHTVKYEGIDGNYLYNRCHLIAYQLAGENANEKNLITGTRYLNIQGMLPFENQVADYVKTTGNHVLYRVTPIFEGDDLLSLGVLMEGYSVEDDGAGICFCIFAYNVQPGINIDYVTGDSTEAASESIQPEPLVSPMPTDLLPAPTERDNSEYVLNTNTMKFHYPYCSSVDDMSEKNKQFFSGSREEIIAMGYVPCKQCHP